MQIVIQTKGFSLTDSLKAYINRRVASALDSRDHFIQRVRVRLSDINGPRGGVDKCCQVRTELNGAPTVVIQDTSENMYAAIDAASERSGQSVGRRIEKLRSVQRASEAQKNFLFNQQTYAE